MPDNLFAVTFRCRIWQNRFPVVSVGNSRVEELRLVLLQRQKRTRVPSGRVVIGKAELDRKKSSVIKPAVFVIAGGLLRQATQCHYCVPVGRLRIARASVQWVPENQSSTGQRFSRLLRCGNHSCRKRPLSGRAGCQQDLLDARYCRCADMSRLAGTRRADSYRAVRYD